MKLAGQLIKYKDCKDVIVLAIPRGGVEVGYEIANSLNARLDIIVTKKIGLPDDEEFAVGSIGPGGEAILNEEAIRIYNISKAYIKEKKLEMLKEIKRRFKCYKGKYELQNLKNKIVILTDDGIATGLTAKSAIKHIKLQKPKKIILAVPVSSADFADEIKKEVDKFVCLHSTNLFSSIGQFYSEFPQLTDGEVKGYLRKIQLQNS